MDLVAEMLFTHLRELDSASLTVELLRPTVPARGRGIGRYVNRYWDYGRWLRRRAGDFDVFHVVDHSYAHLVHLLPAARTIVTCHDADAFMPLVAAGVIPTQLPNAVTRRVLSGMRKAACVTCDSAATFDELRHFDLVDAARLVVVPLGVDPTLLKDPGHDDEAAVEAIVGPRHTGTVDLLHVGSSIPRKRIDVLLRVLSAVRAVDPRVRLLKAGGGLTDEQMSLARSLGVDSHVVQLPYLNASTLAALYRRADVVLVTSDREGFGLPVVEALAAGTVVVASDISSLREVGGSAARFVAVGDVAAWRDAVLAELQERDRPREQRVARGRAQAAVFTWPACTATMARIYQETGHAARRGDSSRESMSRPLDERAGS